MIYPILTGIALSGFLGNFVFFVHTYSFLNLVGLLAGAYSTYYFYNKRR